jgi:hypothetical protein
MLRGHDLWCVRSIFDIHLRARGLPDDGHRLHNLGELLLRGVHGEPLCQPVFECGSRELVDSKRLFLRHGRRWRSGDDGGGIVSGWSRCPSSSLAQTRMN